MRTGAAEDSGDLDELDWDPIAQLSAPCRYISCARLDRTHLAESIFAMWYVDGVGLAEVMSFDS